MTDMMRLRQMVEDARASGDPSDILHRASTDGLVSLFNGMAPRDLHIADSAMVQLTIVGERGALTGRDVSVVTDHFARAVASIGQELVTTGARSTAMTAKDYERAPIFPLTQPGGPLTFMAGAGGLLWDGQGVQSLAAQAMTRLINMLPGESADDRLADRILSSRIPTARAVHEVAQAAKRLDGLTLALRGGSEDVDAVVDRDQAGLISDLLQDLRETVVAQTYHGRLDGVRFRRRMFFLETGEHADIEGTVDEGLIPQIKHLLDRRVVARVERVTRTDGAGRTHRATYRLVALAPEGEQLDLS